MCDQPLLFAAKYVCIRNQEVPRYVYAHSVLIAHVSSLDTRVLRLT